MERDKETTLQTELYSLEEPEGGSLSGHEDHSPQPVGVFVHLLHCFLKEHL